MRRQPEYPPVASIGLHRSGARMIMGDAILIAGLASCRLVYLQRSLVDQRQRAPGSGARRKQE
jgi:hypothetical protein